MKKVEKLRSKEYKEVIQVNLLTRYYWDKNGFDGIEFGPLPKLTPNQHKMLEKISKQMITPRKRKR